MPVYEYECPRCGPFTDLRPLVEFASPQPCPACGGAAPRAMLTAPGIGMTNTARRTAFATNERSASEPRRSSGHGAGCGCCSGKTSPAKPGPSAAKGFPAARPWMISH